MYDYTPIFGDEKHPLKVTDSTPKTMQFKDDGDFDMTSPNDLLVRELQARVNSRVKIAATDGGRSKGSYKEVFGVGERQARNILNQPEAMTADQVDVLARKLECTVDYLRRLTDDPKYKFRDAATIARLYDMLTPTWRDIVAHVVDAGLVAAPMDERFYNWTDAM